MKAPGSLHASACHCSQHETLLPCTTHAGLSASLHATCLVKESMAHVTGIVRQARNHTASQARLCAAAGCGVGLRLQPLLQLSARMQLPVLCWTQPPDRSPETGARSSCQNGGSVQRRYTQSCNQQLQDTALSTSQKAWSTCSSCSQECVCAMRRVAG